MDQIVERAVRTIRERYAETLSLDDVARAALVSKFHLLRVFRQTVGVTPGRFLGAVRIDEAKRLLRDSDRGVAAIACLVGYSSTGSFTSRFTESVGIPPVRYRQVSRGAGDFPVRAVGDPGGRPVRGVARAAARSPVSIGTFDSPILQGRPSSWATLEHPGPFVLHQVPYGMWYLHAAMRAGGVLFTATLGPLPVEPCAGPEVDLVLCPRDWSQPPVLFAVPGLEEPALQPGSSGRRADSSIC
ncbi:helix-turn-helix domain-containing protein [Paractinoplanes lichenicola]|uniref:Helix-turn-helix transcriptional regulator n=1 Tax=Paractinoplanes lichenicola TaxID=2802976 RepID=A0ABS1VFA8_9ACTN|nr:AraC family transcriptional regulator [Actinoplanes lichenicola]MBL7253390.1 helix-turn-helix transcriptional regulator [Actinoplanes lichenicola]